jgi:hypothetical protein
VYFYRVYDSEYDFKVLAENEDDAIEEAQALLAEHDNPYKFDPHVQDADDEDEEDDEDEDGDEDEDEDDEDPALRRILLKNWKEDAVIGSRVGVEVAIREADLAKLEELPEWLRDFDTGTIEFQGSACRRFKLSRMTQDHFVAQMSRLFREDWSLLILHKGAWHPFSLHVPGSPSNSTADAANSPNSEAQS